MGVRFGKKKKKKVRQNIGIDGLFFELFVVAAKYLFCFLFLLKPQFTQLLALDLQMAAHDHSHLLGELT